jgi:uncharacterized protein YbjT (DUF2867 family)
VALAKAARQADVTLFAVVSTFGANTQAGSFYGRVKGEMEAAVTQLGVDCVVIARPSLLTGSRSDLCQPQRPGEKLALAATAPIRFLMPKAYRPIAAATLARAMLRAVAEGPPGVRVVQSAELWLLGTAT